MRAWMLSHVWLFATPWTVAHQAPMSMGFPRQEYWRGLPFPTLGDLPKPGIKQISLETPALPGRFFFFFPHWATWEALNLHEKELFLRLYLMFELSLSLSNFPYPKENISFEEHTFYSVYINGVKLNWLKQIFAEIMSMRLW